MSKRSLFIVLILVFCAGRIVAAVERSFFSNPLGIKETLKTTITDEMLRKSPSWRQEAENPPLSGRRALQLAEKHVNAAVAPDKKWERRLESLALIPMDDMWFWKADFEWWPVGGGIGGRPPDYTVVILMDGTIVPGKVDKAGK